MFLLFWLLLIFLCWGSFLNVVAYRLTYDVPFFTKRSQCPSCSSVIPWYDNIPVFSWILLRARCRFCKTSISILYPFIELASGLIFLTLYICDLLSVSSFIFVSALLVAVRTDLQAMVIPQLVSLWLVPVGILMSFFGMTGISGLDSVLGAIIGYGLLWSVAALFRVLAKKDGLGVGDMELLAMIGSFLGPLGVWFSLLIGSTSGLLVGGGYLLVTKKGRHERIPFGPFLALGAIIYYLVVYFGSNT
jgi:leader peptidase (prepilin peptidase)/N-methyltransferase